LLVKENRIKKEIKHVSLTKKKRKKIAIMGGECVLRRGFHSSLGGGGDINKVRKKGRDFSKHRGGQSENVRNIFKLYPYRT